jgi:hypothetical protein
MDDQASGLDSQRIRQHAAARRAAERSRSHAIIGAIACQVLAVQFAWWAWKGFALLWLPLAVAAQLAAIRLVRLAASLRRSAAAAMPPPQPPLAPPDFSTLGDGSQRYNDLENVR